jgi:hypothetical protein
LVRCKYEVLNQISQEAQDLLYPLFRFSEDRTGVRLRLESDQGAGTRPTLHIKKYVFLKFHDEQCYAKTPTLILYSFLRRGERTVLIGHAQSKFKACSIMK